MTTKAETTKTKGKAPKITERGYKGHLAGSRKGDVHQIFDKKGAAAAEALGAELGLKPGTLKSWIAGWARATKATTKPTPKKAAKESASAESKAKAKEQPAKAA